MDALVEEAREFAHWAHGSIDQRRKYTNEPYIVHPAEVAELVGTVPHTPEMLAAAWLHDTVEDVESVTLEMIRERFGLVVGKHVEELSDGPAGKGASRAERKAADRMRLWGASPGTKTIKLADLLSNTRSIVEHDKPFAKLYVREKALALCVLTAGDPTLLGLAFRSLNDAADLLRIDILGRQDAR